MGLPRGEIMPEQPHSFCDGMTGSVYEERVILSLTLALGRASDAVSHVTLAGSLGANLGCFVLFS